MRKFTRLAEPEFLTARGAEWGLAWERRRSANPKAVFHWHQVAGHRVNTLVLPRLKAQTQDHCSFCDNFPVCPPGLDTIEHFRPKSSFPREAYRWENLYFCCCFCQQQGDSFDEATLRPDAADYSFERYFRFDYTRGTIEANQRASPEEQHRAEVTIRTYRLNERHPPLRRVWLIRRAKMPDDPLDGFPYRDYLEDAAGP